MTLIKKSSNDKSLSLVTHTFASFSLSSDVHADTPALLSVSKSSSDDAVEFVCQNDSTSIWLNAGANIGNIINASLIDIQCYFFNARSMQIVIFA